MNYFDRCVLRGILFKTFRQGGHRQRATNLFAAINAAHREEFYEDNKATREIFLRECLEESFEST